LITWVKQLPKRNIILIAAVMSLGAVGTVAALSGSATPAASAASASHKTAKKSAAQKKAEKKAAAAAKKAAEQAAAAAAAAAAQKAAAAKPAPAPPPAPALTPSKLLGLTNWKVTLPVAGANGSAAEIKQPQLGTYSDNYFHLNGAQNGVVFNAPVNGVTTSGSSFPRSELREMSGGQSASWSSVSGTHTMVVRQAITHLPGRGRIVSAQIHDASDDVIEIYLNGSTLSVKANGGQTVGTLNPAYVLGTPFTLQITAANGIITVTYNGATTVSYPSVGSGYYFKAGAYTQSNMSYESDPSAYGEVVIYSLQVSHS
jgi:hypothetical protein